RWERWDRTVLILPPPDETLGSLDNDPLIQQFPFCVWANAFHTRSLTHLRPVKDLVDRMARLAALPESERARLTSPAERLQASPIDLLSFAAEVEAENTMTAAFADQSDKGVRWCAFWNLFRAASLRMVASPADDRSAANRTTLADDLLQMSVIMLDFEEEGD